MKIETAFPNLAITPEEALIGMKVCGFLEATTKDITEAEEECGILLEKPHYEWVDRHIAPCLDCDYWCKLCELDDDQHCTGCSTRLIGEGAVEDQEQEF